MISDSNGNSGKQRAMVKIVQAIVGFSIVILTSGCITGPAESSTHKATEIDVAQATPYYWLDQPAVASVEGKSYDELFETCRETARFYQFKVDRLDYRTGVITTQPLISQQWFEFWKRDVQTIGDWAVSSVATMRRTIRFEITRNEDDSGGYTMVPKVLVERETIAGRRVTTAIQYTSVFGAGGSQPAGSPEADEGILIAPVYWCPVARDHALERKLAESVQHRLK